MPRGKGGGGGTPGDMPCLVCFVNQLFINLGIPFDHTSFLHKHCNTVDAFWHHLFLIAIYRTNFLICVPYHRSEHSPGVRFCKYLLVHLLTGRHVSFSYFAFTFCPLPVSITLSNILSWTVCIIGLNLKKTDPKQAIEWKKCIKSTTLRIQNTDNSARILF